MFERKADVDRHVEYNLKKLNTEKERNLRGLAFSKLYYKVGDYESARRYISVYLTVKSESPEGQLMLGKVLEKLGRKEEAFEAYRSSLELDPKQKGLVIKVCELLASDDKMLEPTRARYWCEQGQLIDPQNTAVFNLRERLMTSENTSPADIRKMYLTELEHRPADVGLRIRLLQHLLQNNQMSEAYKHASEIEQKNLSIFTNNLLWYETVAKILVRYRNDNANNDTLTWEFWMLIITVLDRLVALSLDENSTNVKDLSGCVTAVFNLDQTMFIAADNVNKNCVEKQHSNEFLVHFRAQLCFHVSTLMFKQAKQGNIHYKDAIKMSTPLLLLAYHAQPPELQCVWLEHANDAIRKQVQRWHLGASFRCSQAGHTLLAIAHERRSTFAERVTQLTAGSWREKTYKQIFITRDQQMKLKSSYFATCELLEDIAPRLPDPTELLRYDESAQLAHPDSLHHLIWLGLNTKPVDFRCTIFDGLQFSVKNLSNCAAETLNILDIQAFLYCCIFCAQSQIEESKHLVYYNPVKPNVLPACITEPLGTNTQSKWFSCVYKMFKNETGSDYSNTRVTLIKGIEIVRCAGAHGLDVKLLVMLARTFMEKAKTLSKPSEVEATETRAELYWKNAVPLLEKLKNNHNITYPANRWFDYRAKDMPPSEINMHIEDGKLFSALQLKKKKEYEKALNLLDVLKSPYASYHQAHVYKALAKEQMSHNKENVTSEMRSQHIILLSKARDCYYLTLDRLREPTADRRHPLDAKLGTEIEDIERELSCIDPDNGLNRNECDGLSDENLSSAGSAGDHAHMTSSYMMQSSYHNGHMTPRAEHHHLPSTPYRHMDMGMNHSRRAEARPSPERLDAQLRQMAAAKDVMISNVFDQLKALSDSYRTIIDEVRTFKDSVTVLTTSIDELKDVKKTVEELKTSTEELQQFKEITEQIYEIKRDLAELKKDTTKLKGSQINEEDLYALEEEYGVEYNVNSGAAGFNSAALYPNFPQRLQGANTLAYGAPGLYGMYPMYPYGGLGLGQPGALPFPDGQLPDFRAMGSIAQGLSHTGLAQSQNTIPQPALPAMFPKLPTEQPPYTMPLNPLLQPPQSTSQPLLPTTQPMIPPAQPPPLIQSTHAPAWIAPTTSLAPATTKAPPVNVVITASDPLPTTSATQPILSVTIPPQHLKGNQSKNQPHNYQIPLPATSQPSFSNVSVTNSPAPMPVSTQNLLSTVAPPVYSSLSVKSPPQTTNKGLGLQIEKSLSENFAFSPNTSQSKPDLNRTSASESSILEEHDPCPDFKPIIPLPDKVPLTTGEEGEIVLFSRHAKLYRFVEKEWRERGIGEIKILHNENNGKVRILMRRDQVLKICANHFLTPDMELTPMKNKEQALIWAANDFADENIVLEKLCVRFKTVEDAKHFQEAFENAKTLLKPEVSSPEVKATEKKTSGTKPATPGIQKSESQPNSLGGFVFTSTPTFKPKSEAKPEAVEKQNNVPAAKPSPFAGFTFGAAKADTPKTEKTTAEFKPALISPKPVAKSANLSESQQEGDDFVPSAEFKPVIPLPDLVEVKTGEENAEVLYEARGKLLRFDPTTKEWKERGVGIMKILKEKTIRLLMRREIVHKVCCNHQLFKSMVFTSNPRSNNVVNWCAPDFSDNVLKTEMFALKFKHAETCEEFLNTINKAKDMLDSSSNVITAADRVYTTPGKKDQSTWAERFKPQEGSWECASCYLRNSDGSDVCVACQTPMNSQLSDSSQSPQKFKQSPAPQPIQAGWGDKFKPKGGTWECRVCYVHNKAKNNHCEACDSPKNDSIPKKDVSVNLDVSGQQFSFGSATDVKSYSPAATVGFGDKFKPKPGSWECKVCYISNNADAKYCVACDNPKDDTVPKKENKGIDLGAVGDQKFSFGIPASSATAPKPVETNLFGEKPKQTSGFTFGMPPTTTSAGFSFGAPKPQASEASEAAPLNLAPSKPTFTFTLNKPATDVTPAKKEEFVFGSPSKHEFEFKPRSPRKHSGGDGDAESDGSGSEEECDNIYFKPAVPLPDKIVVLTGEEEETVLYCHRAKLFRFCDKEWKERGVGDIKVLKKPDTGKLRVVMRRDQVLKLCLNHSLTDDIVYKPKDDRTWLFSAGDYSDGEINYQQFCVRFKNAEIAKEFMEAIEKARKEFSTTDNAKTTTDEPKTTASAPEQEKDDDDDDIEIVYELKVTPEQEEAALKLQLPRNFYAYLQKEPCKGCIGCHDEDFVFYTPVDKSVPTSKAAVKQYSEEPSTDNKPKFVFQTPKSSVSSIFSTPTTNSISETSMYATPPSNSTSTSFMFSPQTTITSTTIKSNNTSSVLASPKLNNTSLFNNTSGSQKSDITIKSLLAQNTPTTLDSSPVKTTPTIFGNQGTSTFSFNQSKPSATPTFGAAATFSQPKLENTTQGSLFGSQITFGSKQTEASAKVFGTTASTNMFSGSTTTANIFGGKPLTTTTTTTASMFGTATTTSSIFGATTPSMFSTTTTPSMFSTTTTSNMFSAPTTTSNMFSTPTTKSNMFGTSTTTSSLFALTTTGSLFSTPTATSNVFGTPTTTSSVFGTTTTTLTPKFTAPTTTSSMFSTPTTTTSSMFGTPTTTTSSMFGTPTTSSMFGTTTTTTSSMFGTATTTTSSMFGTATTTTSSMFGTPTTTTSSMFGMTTTTTTTSSMFGTPTTTSSIFSAPTTNIFSGSATKPSIFGGGSNSSSTPNTTGSLLSTPSTTPSTNTTVFGSSGNTPTMFGGSNMFGTQTTSTGLLTTPTTTPSFSFMAATSTVPPFTGTSAAETVFSATNTSFISASATSSSLFNTATTSTKSLFGGSPNANIFGGFGSTRVFGGSATTTAQNTSATAPVTTSAPAKTAFGLQPVFGAGLTTQPTKSTEQTMDKGFLNVENAPSFASLAQQNTTTAAEPILKCDSDLSFASLASENKTFLAKKDNSKSFQFSGTGTPLFSSTTLNQASQGVSPLKKDANNSNKTDKDEDEAEEENEDGEEHDPKFEPIVPLPDKIVVKTGEEDEKIMFNERAKLYRYDTKGKEWKERGVGQIKILHHEGNDTYRFVMRREHVHKLVLNMRITNDIVLKPLQNAEKAWCWAGNNFHDDGDGNSGGVEELAVRFKNIPLSTQFYDVVQKILEHLKEKPVQKEEQQLEEVEEDDEEHEEYSSDESDENRSALFSKQCVLSYKDGDDWISLGSGLLNMYYDAQYFTSGMLVVDENGQIISNTVIQGTTEMTKKDTSCTWESIELSVGEPVQRILKAEFSTSEDAEDMYISFLEARGYARQCEES